MNEVIEKLARRSRGVVGKPEGIDGLILDAVHIRAFAHALDATESNDFEKSYLSVCLQVGATYSVILNITKMYDRESKEYELNSLRKLWMNTKDDREEADLITNEFHTENKTSVFEPLISYRDKCLCHNEKNTTITSEQIDKALHFCARVWFLVGKASDSFVVRPFYEFTQVSGELDKLFSENQLIAAEAAWNKYISEIKDSMENKIS